MESTKEQTIVGNVNTDTKDVAEYIDFDRVNFDIPATIGLYGAKEMNRTQEIVNDVQGLLGDDEIIDPEFEKKLASLPNFTAYLENIEKEKNKLVVYEQEQATAVGVAKFLGKFKPRPGKDIPTYGEVQKDMADTVKYIVASFDKKKGQAFNNIDIRSGLSKQLEESRDKLTRMHAVGLQDAVSYAKNVIEPSEKEITADSDEGKLRLLQAKREMLNAFNKQLFSIQQHIVIINVTIGQLSILNGVELQKISKYSDYANNAANSLSLQVFIMVDSSRQTLELQQIINADKVTNDVVKSNQKRINQGVAVAAKMMEQGTFTDETLKVLANDINTGIKLYKDGVNAAIESREKSAIELARINKQLEALSSGIETDVQQQIAQGMRSDEGYSRSLMPTTRTKKKTLFDNLLGK